MHQMKEGIISNTKLKDILVFCCKVDESLDFKKTILLPGISKYDSIEYEGEKIRFLRYYGIGKGLEKYIKNIIKCDYDQLIGQV